MAEQNIARNTAQEDEQIVFKNVMETLVMQKLDDIINQLDCCKCKKCRLDMASYALNRLPSKYVATQQGELFARLDSISVQQEADVAAMLTLAARIVKEHPRH